MPATIKVKSPHDTARKQRESSAERVVAHFGNSLPALRLLCFFDDEDWRTLKDEEGAANRGFYSPIRPGGLWWPPNYLAECLVVEGQLAFEHLIYLHGSTCSSELGLTMTFAHELQHFIQRNNVPRVWAVNALANRTLQQLGRSEFEASGLRACDVPHEREARIVAKGVAENLFGADAVRRYIEAKVDERVTNQDVTDWECIRGLAASTPYHLPRETELFFPRLKSFRPQLERSLKELRDYDAAFQVLDLDALLSGIL
jgi:hypothetical protein